MFPLYLHYLLIDFRQTFVTGASWDTDDLITFFGSKGQSSRSHPRGGGAQHSTLPSSTTFSSLSCRQNIASSLHKNDVSQLLMFSVDLSKLSFTGLIFINPRVKVSGAYYHEMLLS